MTNGELGRALHAMEIRRWHAEQTLLELAWMRFYSNLLRVASGPYIP